MKHHKTTQNDNLKLAHVVAEKEVRAYRAVAEPVSFIVFICVISRFAFSTFNFL